MISRIRSTLKRKRTARSNSLRDRYTNNPTATVALAVDDELLDDEELPDEDEELLLELELEELLDELLELLDELLAPLLLLLLLLDDNELNP